MSMKIICSDGVITDEHLKALKIGETLVLDDVQAIECENVTIDENALKEDDDS